MKTSEYTYIVGLEGYCVTLLKGSTLSNVTPTASHAGELPILEQHLLLHRRGELKKLPQGSRAGLCRGWGPWQRVCPGLGGEVGARTA